ncbi:hypothetical protein [Nonomuraea jabiensis]|uniref:hypothetical protein n=1 Tax=Nonomuraea jabiensis TaxID=882448 RepID=UPI0036CDC542
MVVSKNGLGLTGCAGGGAAVVIVQLDRVMTLPAASLAPGFRTAVNGQQDRVGAGAVRAVEQSVDVASIASRVGDLLGGDGGDDVQCRRAGVGEVAELVAGQVQDRYFRRPLPRS